MAESPDRMIMCRENANSGYANGIAHDDPDQTVSLVHRILTENLQDFGIRPIRFNDSAFARFSQSLQS
jgi:hypothetical protein